MTPVTDLPYVMVLRADVLIEGAGIQTLKDERDTDYLAHAANAYPRLVDALKALILPLPDQGSQNANMREVYYRRELAIELLRELGEG